MRISIKIKSKASGLSMRRTRARFECDSSVQMTITGGLFQACPMTPNMCDRPCCAAPHTQSVSCFQRYLGWSFKIRRGWEMRRGKLRWTFVRVGEGERHRMALVVHPVFPLWVVRVQLLPKAAPQTVLLHERTYGQKSNVLCLKLHPISALRN